MLLREENIRDLDLDNFLVASPHERIVNDLKQRVATDHGFHEDEIRLDLLGLGGRGYRSSRIYRVVGDAIGNGARVRVKSSGQLGTVRGVIEMPSGPRYLVLHDLNPDDFEFGERLPTRSGQNYATDDLDFLYVVRTGGWPDEYPDWLIEATSPNGPDLSSLVGRIRRTPW
jgi:hypothetical protein